MISIGSKGLKVIKPAAKAVQFWNEKSNFAFARAGAKPPKPGSVRHSLLRFVGSMCFIFSIQYCQASSFSA